MATETAGKLIVHRVGAMGGIGGPETFVCTTCGLVVAAEYGQRHINWENTAKGATVVTVVGTPPNGLPLGS
jgi:hypothetical protein